MMPDGYLKRLEIDLTMSASDSSDVAVERLASLEKSRVARNLRNSSLDLPATSFSKASYIGRLRDVERLE
jgi:hypothetical protein